MPTPPKPVAVLRGEKKSHRTKAELEMREKAEGQLLSGKKMREQAGVSGNAVAHQTYLRVVKILESIGKNDALYENVINRYCMISAEVAEYEKTRRRLENRAQQLEDWRESGEIDYEEYWSKQGEIIDDQIACDAMLQRKRKMLLDIERENVMTVAASLRAIPKQVDAGDAGNDPMAQMLDARLNRGYGT